MMEKLTVTKAIELAGNKTKFKWTAPIYEGNIGHYGYGKAGGIANLYDVRKSVISEKPSHHVVANIIEGDDLNYAIAGGRHVPTSEADMFHFSDSDRFVMFEILED